MTTKKVSLLALILIPSIPNFATDPTPTDQSNHYIFQNGYLMEADHVDAVEEEAEQESQIVAPFRLALPDGTLLYIEIPTQSETDKAAAETPSENETVLLTLPSGLNLSLKMSAPNSESRLLPRPGIGSDETDESVIPDPEGIIVDIPMGSTVSITASVFEPSARPTRKPPRKGLAEDDTDEEDTSDPEGLISILPGGGTLRVNRTE